MLRPSFTNDAMRTLIHQLQTDWHPEWGDPAAWHAELTWRLTADIDRLVARIRDRYAIDRGRPAHDPATLFRFLGLLTVREVASLVDGLQQVRQSPLLARLCGWSTPDAIPAIGTIYGFLRRWVPGARPRQGAWRRPSGRRLTLKSGQKMPPRRPGAVARVARRVLREAQRGRRRGIWPRMGHPSTAGPIPSGTSGAHARANAVPAYGGLVTRWRCWGGIAIAIAISSDTCPWPWPSSMACPTIRVIRCW